MQQTAAISLIGRATRAIAVMAVSTGFALVATLILGAWGNIRAWCCINTFALQHGAGPGVFLLFALLGFHGVRSLARRHAGYPLSTGFGLLAHIAYVAAALGTFPVPSNFVDLPVPPFFSYFKWLGLAAGLMAVIARTRGHTVRQFGLAVIGLVVSALVTYFALTFRGYLA